MPFQYQIYFFSQLLKITVLPEFRLCHTNLSLYARDLPFSAAFLISSSIKVFLHNKAFPEKLWKVYVTICFWRIAILFLVDKLPGHFNLRLHWGFFFYFSNHNNFPFASYFDFTSNLKCGLMTASNRVTHRRKALTL